MRRATTVLNVFLFLLIQNGMACPEYGDSTRSKHRYLPHYVSVQFAGNIGLFSIGAGYTSRHANYQLSLLYGYVPASIAESHIHTIAVKNIFPLTRYLLKNGDMFTPYLGLGLTVELGGNAFFRNPAQFPKGYYDFPKNIHVIGYGGVKLQHLFREEVNLLRGIEFYAEAGTVDVYVWYKTISDQISLNQIFTIALGVNLLLHH